MVSIYFTLSRRLDKRESTQDGESHFLRSHFFLITRIFAEKAGVPVLWRMIWNENSVHWVAPLQTHRKISVKHILSIFVSCDYWIVKSYCIRKFRPFSARMHTSKTIAAFAIVAMTSLIPYNLFMNAHQVCLFVCIFFAFVRLKSRWYFQYFYYKLRNATDFSAVNDTSLLDDILAADRNQSSLSLGKFALVRRKKELWRETVMKGFR